MKQWIDSTGPHPRWSWLWLVALLLAPVLYAALAQDIGALAYDAALQHIDRGVVFSSMISEGVLYPRWAQVLHWGLGSPLFTFQPPLPYYGLDLLYRLGIPHPLGWRFLIAAGYILAFVGAYLLVYEVTSRRWPAVVAAVAFVYAPYVLRNALERGSNEAYSMLLYPLVLWSLLWLAKRPSGGRFLIAVLAWAACIASHVLGPLMLAPFATGLALWLTWRYRTLAPLGALLIGGLLTAAIWAPMGPEQAWVHVERDFTQPDAMPEQNPISLGALLAPPAVYDTVRDYNGTGDRVGLLHTAILLAGFPVALYAWRRKHRLTAALVVATMAGLFLFWLFTAASDELWRASVPLLSRLLYRTRLMGIQALAVAVVCGLLIAVMRPRWQRWMGLVVCGLLVASAMPSLYVELQHHFTAFRSPVDLAHVRATEIRMGGTALTAFAEFAPRWRTDSFNDALLRELGPDFDARSQPFAGAPDTVRLLSSDVRSQAWNLEVAASEPATLTLHLLYYPRWTASVDGGITTLAPQDVTGYAQVRVAAGTHRVELRYESTTVERAGLAVSGLTALGLLVVAGLALMRSRRARSRFEVAAATVRSPSGAELTPPVWLLGALTVLLIFKLAYVDTATTWLRCTSTPARVCDAQSTVDVGFSGAPRLRGYTVPSSTARSGDELRVDLYWQGEPGADKTLSSFVHIRNSRKDQPLNPRSSGEIWAQTEHVAPGGLSSAKYLPGKLYKDEFRVPLPEDMPPGEYFLEVGWFDPQSGEQLDPQAETVKPPLKILWRSILLPSVQVR